MLWLGSSMALWAAAATTNAQPAPGGTDDFAQYLIDHKDVLQPFFKAHSPELIKESIPFFFTIMGNVILINLIIGWIIDVAAGRGFSIFYAPTYAKITPAIVYATARLVLIVGLMLLGSLACVFIGFLHAPLALMIFIGFLLILDLMFEICLVCIVYRTSAIVATLFYIGLIVIHGILGTALTGTLIEMRVASLVTNFVDERITPQVNDEVKREKKDLQIVAADRDSMKAKMTDLQNRLAQAQAEQDQFKQQIDAKKNSPTYIFSQIVRLRAQGNETDARDQLNAFLAKYPNGPLADAAKAQVAGVSSDLAAQEAAKKQAEADAAAAAAAARADLLAKASRGEATLADMREALIGKTRADIKGMFGDPTETASDRWGYVAQMVMNPLTGEKHGLAIYFSEGTVLSVDYYYGR
ncbi:MAG: hypothetical protein LV479_11135 [Methylacidiphilales bacterium]|nr:hypothetical protein [Candidatus Methylacidiphilales bacterium]